jgi:hypothetical protein
MLHDALMHVQDYSLTLTSFQSLRQLEQVACWGIRPAQGSMPQLQGSWQWRNVAVPAPCPSVLMPTARERESALLLHPQHAPSSSSLRTHGTFCTWLVATLSLLHYLHCLVRL